MTEENTSTNSDQQSDNERIRDEWADMLFKRKPYNLDREKHERNIELEKKLWLLKRGLHSR